MNVHIKVIDDTHKKHPVTIEGVGYIIIDNNWIRFGKDAMNPKDDACAISRKGTSAKVIVWEGVTSDAQ